MAIEDSGPEALADRAERMLGELETLPEPARGTALALVRALLELYGEGLARLTGIALDTGGEAARAAVTGDPLVSHLLALHGRHPVAPLDRAEQAVAAVRPRLGGAQPQLLAVEDGVARLRLTVGAGCRSRAEAAHAALADAVRAAVPELERVDVEQTTAAPVIPLENLRSRA